MRRLVAFPLTLILIGLAMVLVPILGIQMLAGDVPRDRVLLVALAHCLAGLAGYAAFAHWVERRAMVELEGLFGWLELLAGLGLGAVLFGLTFGSIWLAGGVVLDGVNPAPDLGYAAAMSIIAGVGEELVFRGIVFRLLERWLGSWAALALSAALFGGMHMTNPDATLFAAVAISIEAGIMLAAAFMVTRRLYLAIGLHIGWNFTQGGLFGVAVSGNALEGWQMTHPVGPDWLSGGNFGAEASVLAVIWCTAFGCALLVLARRRGQIMRAREQDGEAATTPQ